MTDCIVIGGGLIGMLTARELAEGGLTVTLVERGRAGREASWAGGGILSPLYPWRFAQAITVLAGWSQGRYRFLSEALRQETGIDPQWTRSGLLMLNVQDPTEALAWGTEHRIGIQRLGPEAASTVEPALQIPHGDALWMPGVAQIRNPRLIKALRRSLELRGMDIREHTEVTGLLAEDHIQGVRTAAGIIEASRVVVASGAWSGQLVEPMGWSLPITPVKGQMILFQGEPGLLRRMVMEGSHYLIPRRDGRILAGSTVEHRGFDKSTTPQAREELHKAALSLIPALAECSIERHWTGLRPGSPDGIPYIGEHPALPELYIHTGHYRNGIVIGPASARLLADLILGRTPIVDPAPYDPAHRSGPGGSRPDGR